MKSLIMAEKVLFIVCIFMILYPTGFCNAMNSGEETVNKTSVTIRKWDNRKEITVKSGDIFSIELEEVGAAGYSWFVDSLNTEYIEIVSRKTKLISEGKLGGPVLAVWMFRAKKKGSAEINLDYYRAWEGKETAKEHFSIKLLIQ
jgi:predicted secreted protein